MLLMLVSFLFNKDSRAISIRPLVDSYLMFFMFYAIINNLQDRNVIYGAIVGIIVVNMLMVYMQILRMDPLCLDDQARHNTHIVGLFGYPMNLGAWMACALPYVFHKNKWLFIPVFLMMVMSDSWAAIGVGIIGLMFYIWFWNKKIFKGACYLIIAASILVSLYCVFTLSSVQKKEIINKVTLRVETQVPLIRPILSRPYFGYGLGTWQVVIPQVKEIDHDRIGLIDVTWCDPLGCALELGLISVFLMFCFFRAEVRKFIQSRKDLELVSLFGSLITISLGMLFHSYMNYINISVFCVLMYCVYRIKQEEISYEDSVCRSKA